MTKFKIGDKVRVIDSEADDVYIYTKVGSEGIVVGIEDVEDWDDERLRVRWTKYTGDKPRTEEGDVFAMREDLVEITGSVVWDLLIIKNNILQQVGK